MTSSKPPKTTNQLDAPGFFFGGGNSRQNSSLTQRDYNNYVMRQ